MVSFSFLYPTYLFFLFLIPLYIFIHLVTLRSAKSTALKFANFEAIARIKGVDFLSKNLIILVLSVLIIFLLVMAVSGLNLHITTSSSEHSFIIAIDSSKSMSANDMDPNRMEAAKRAAQRFIDILPIATKAGIISFSGNSFIEQDITESKSALKSAISDIQISEIGGTDIYEAVITSTNLLRGEASKAIILLSDGQINVGGVEESVLYANENGVIVHTIAIGTSEGGEASFGISKLDEDTLDALAYNTDGVFFKAESEEELFESLSDAILSTRQKVTLNMTGYLITAVIILFSIEFYLINSRYRRLV